MAWTLYFDGACEPRNPGGKATYGWVLKERDTVRARGWGFAAEGPGSTNNVAEYAALTNGLKGTLAFWKAFEEPRQRFLEVCGDSKLVVNQVSGAWSIKAPHLRPLVVACRSLLKNLVFDYEHWYRLKWIPREENQEADYLSKLAYQEACRGVLTLGKSYRAAVKKTEVTSENQIPV